MLSISITQTVLPFQNNSSLYKIAKNLEILLSSPCQSRISLKDSKNPEKLLDKKEKG